MVKYISDRIGVMYLGKMVEMTFSDELYKNPLHPYTQGFAGDTYTGSIFRNKPTGNLKGDVPSPIDPTVGVQIQNTLSLRLDICKEQEPITKELAPDFCACHLY